jgi:protein phosphatase
LGGAASEAVIARLTGIAHGETVHVDDLRAAMRQADDDIRTLAASGVTTDGAGTTVAGIALVESGTGPYWAVFHVGDSRIYRWAPGSWERVSNDHSVVQEMLDGGAITEAQALLHPSRHVITRAVGLGVRAEADFTLLPLDGAERFLICSDGLTGELSDGRIGEVMSGTATAEEVAAQLVSEAVDAGGADNVSVVVVHVHNDRSSDEDPEIDALDDATIPRVTLPVEQPEGVS